MRAYTCKQEPAELARLTQPTMQCYNCPPLLLANACVTGDLLLSTEVLHAAFR